MTALMTATESACLSAQLAFIRSERLAQRSHRRSFQQPDGRPTPRQERLSALVDDVVEDTMARLRTLPAWGQATLATKTAVRLITEAVISAGAGCRPSDVERLAEAAVDLSSVPPTLLPNPLIQPTNPVSLPSFYYTVGFTDAVAGWIWPIVIPLDVASDAEQKMSPPIPGAVS